MPVNRDVLLRVRFFSIVFNQMCIFLGYRCTSFCVHKHVRLYFQSNDTGKVSIHFLVRALLANWLPMSYILSQMAIIFLGLWAIVDRENVIQVELVCIIKLVFLDNLLFS
jgi:hypothetical protein